MVQVSLTREELAALSEVLEGYIPDLRMEVSRTDSKSFRDMLKAREALLVKVLATLREAREAA
jgi:hypothetical protein